VDLARLPRSVGRDLGGEGQLQSLVQSLIAAQKVLDDAANSHPSLRGPSRAIRRLARVASRPYRLAILGESNSGKSSIANFLIGGVTLPALPVANTRLPTLLYYAPVPVAGALHANGKRYAVSPHDDVPLQHTIRLEVGLPARLLRSLEILDFPGSANPLFPARPEAAVRHGIDAAIWTTVATQAWRETERLAWAGLPPRIRSSGVLAVTHCDLVATREDFQKLKARLQVVALAHFSTLCFVAAGGATPAGSRETGSGGDLFSAIGNLAHQFAEHRRAKAVRVARQLAAQTLAGLENAPAGA
jgi:hypothetical protein